MPRSGACEVLAPSGSASEQESETIARFDVGSSAWAQGTRGPIASAARGLGDQNCRPVGLNGARLSIERRISGFSTDRIRGTDKSVGDEFRAERVRDQSTG